MTVRLRPFERADLEAVLQWLPAVTAEAGVTRSADDMLSLLRKRATVRTFEADGRAAGVVVWTVADGRGRFELLALEPAARRRGRGLEAALLAEEDLRAQGVREALAPAPAAHGIAIYFWLRLGYRMLDRDRWPACDAALEPVGWMGRPLTDGQAARRSMR